MQISIFKIFGNIRSLLLLILLLTILLTLAILSEHASFNKLENLQKEKELATEIYTLGRKDLDYANVQYLGKSTMLRHEGEMLASYYEYDYVIQLFQTGNYRNDIVKLQYAIDDFNKAASAWFTKKQLVEAELQERSTHLAMTYDQLMAQINSTISDNLLFEKKRFDLQQLLVVALSIISLFGFGWIVLRLAQIRKDLKTLYAFEYNEAAKFTTIEANTISKIIGRSGKATGPDNPAFLDAVTGISNYRGLVNEYARKKSIKSGNYTAVCVFAIDKFNEVESQYSQEFSDTILKKVGFMLALYRQHNDMIARLDNNQFIIILSRQNQTSALNDCELIRKSIQESTFKTSDKQSLTITVSGGFVQKLAAESLDESIAKAGRVLFLSMQHGGNRIAQLREKSSMPK